MKTRQLTITALFSAMICVATVFIHIPVPMSGGYAHIGDGFIFLASCILPSSYAAVAASLGAGLADAMGGYYAYILPTIIIKAIITVPLSSKRNRIASPQNISGAAVGGIIGTGGYFIADWVIYGNKATAAANLLAGAVQPVMSVLVFVIIGCALDKSEIRRLI